MTTVAHVSCPVDGCAGTVDVEVETKTGNPTRDHSTVDVVCTKWRTVGGNHNHEPTEGEFPC